MVEPLIGKVCKSDDTVLDLNVGDALVEGLGHILAHNGMSTSSLNITDKTVRIHSHALDGDKEDAACGLTRVVDQVGNLYLGVSNHLQGLD